MPPVVISVHPYGDPISAPSYVTSVNSYRAPNEEHVGVLQEEMRTTLEEVKYLENIIASGEIKVDEAYQLQGLYMIK